MDKVQKYNSFNTNTPSSESYRNYQSTVQFWAPFWKGVHEVLHTAVSVYVPTSLERMCRISQNSERISISRSGNGHSLTHYK
jgi:hypothetical protein